MENSNQVVAVTGASGYLGSRLLLHLEEQDLGKLVGFDLNPPPNPIHNIVRYRMDVKDSIEDILRNHRVTTVVHLASSPYRNYNRRDNRNARDNNLNLLNSVLQSSYRSEVRQIVYISSHTVYGARSDNPVPLTEKAPLLISEEFPYGYEQFLADQTLDTFSEDHPETKVALLRCSPILGPSAANRLFTLFMQPNPVGTTGFNPSFQFLHEDDFAKLLTIFINKELAGVFNVAGNGVIFLNEISEMISHRIPKLPSYVANPLFVFSQLLGIQKSQSPMDLDFLRYHTILSTGKLEYVSGFRPAYSSLETMRSYANSVLY